MAETSHPPTPHPLTDKALAYFATHTEADVTTMAIWLGAPSRPVYDSMDPIMAYRLVAADVLLAMARHGLLRQYGRVPPRPERGGHWYTLPRQTNPGGAPHA